MRFNECLEFVLKWEGGFTDGKTGASRFDKGGATAFGITQKAYDDWRVGQSLCRNPVSGISDDEVRSIYFARYWKSSHAHTCHQPVDLVLFDSAVNCGPRQAVKFLQRALNIPDDGSFGPVTENSLKTSIYPPQEVAKRLIDEREQFYQQIVGHDHTQAVFLKGWLNRLNSLRKEIE